MELVITQSMLKSFFVRGDVIDHCPLHNKLLYIDKELEIVPNEYMLYGMFFESKAIGFTSRGNKYVSLPKTSTFKTTSIEDRLNNQVNRFRYLVMKYDMVISEANTQVKHRLLYKDHDFEDIDIYLEGTADILSPFRYGDKYEVSCIDLKITRDITSKQSSYSWGNYPEIDNIQAVMYSLLFSMPFYYMVFDYSPQLNYGIFPYIPTKLDYVQLQETIRKYVMLYLEHENNQWPAVKCKKCDLCSVRLHRKCPLHL